MTDMEIEQKIHQFFEENYEILRMEGGHALSDYIKQTAFEQVLYYYKKMKPTIEKITDVEVKLTLPNLQTPAGRRFTIEGVVDIVRENEETWLYDIKTHELDYVQSNVELYEEQLNVYAHIWQELRQNKLDCAAIISTSIPKPLKKAIKSEDTERIIKEITVWNPVVEIDFKQDNVVQTIEAFGQVVDDIEEKRFEAPGLDKLKEVVQGRNEIFATAVCRNCDVRFSCDSYRTYLLENSKGRSESFVKYVSQIATDEELDDYKEANLVSPTVSNLEDF